ncbi:MAG: NAD(P)/FAD-dependent oxidoreductase, partial [Candidatus Margulisiibacteriota bacterium]
MTEYVIVGAGPAGSACALHLAQSGKTVTLIEADQLGGTCLNVGCIPTKSFLYRANQTKMLSQLGISPETVKSLQMHSIQDSTTRLIKRSRLAIEQQVKQSGITLLHGTVTSFDADSVTLFTQDKVCFEKLILATGTEPWIPPTFEKIATHPRLLTNNTIFSLEEIPRQITIVGGGAIGVEFAFFFSLMGSSVTLCEAAPSILPQLDTDIVAAIRRQLKLQKVALLENMSIQAISSELTLTLSTGETQSCEYLLLATGRRAVMIPTALPFDHSPQGFILVNNDYQTPHSNIYAIGDLNGKSLLAHSATAQGHALAKRLLSQKTSPLSSIPFIVYSNPTAASVGLRSQDIEGSSRYRTNIVSMNLL